MPFDYIDDQPQSGGKFEYLDDQPSIGGLAENAVKNVGRMLNPIPMAEQVKTGAFDLPKEATETLAQVVGNTVAGEPIGETPMAKRAADMAASEPVQHPANWAYKNPIDAAALVAAPVMAFMPGKAPIETPKSTPEAPKIPPQEPPPGPPDGSATTPPSAEPTAQTPSPAPFASEAQQALGKAKEIKDYINRGYEGFAKKPGAVANVADYIQEKSQMMAAQQMGATPLQARQVGHEGMRALGQYALDNGIVSRSVGLKGMRARMTELNTAAGDTIGALRKSSDAIRDPLKMPIDVLQEVRQRLDAKYGRGVASGEAGSYAKALQEVEDSKPTFEGFADTATKLNRAANEANRLNQPHTAYTDVANIISEVNNERIKVLLGPEKAAQYEKSLRDFGATKKIGEFLKRKEAGEVKRMGPGSTISNFIQKGMDEIGYRVGAETANKVSTSVLKNPAVAKSLPSLFKEFIHQVEEVGNDVTGMAHGGIVGVPDIDKEIHHHLRKEFDREYAGLFQK